MAFLQNASNTARTPQSVTAAGTTQATATQLVGATSYQKITGAGGASQGVILPVDTQDVVVVNTLATQQIIYPPSGMQIDNSGSNTGIVMAPGGRMDFLYLSSTVITSNRSALFTNAVNPSPVASAAAVGSSGYAARLDHVHALPTNLPQILATVTGINGLSTANTALYTVPTGKTAIITGFVDRVTAATAVTQAPGVGIGNAAGTSNILASQPLTGLTAANATFQGLVSSASVSTAAGGVIYHNLGTAGAGTTLTLACDLIGYLV